MEPAQLKATLKAGKPAFGFMIAAIEGLRWSRLYAGSTLDYIIIDWEHSSRNRQRIAELVTSVKSAGVTCIVRTPNTDDTYVAMALDAGADGVLVPYCETVEEVRACANKVRLHPLKGEYFERASMTGELPSEKTREYLHNRHKDHIFIMGIESEPAANRLDELLECAEIDGIFVGPNDMTTSLGIPDEVDNQIYLDVLKKRHRHWRETRRPNDGAPTVDRDVLEGHRVRCPFRASLQRCRDSPQRDPKRLRSAARDRLREVWWRRSPRG
jgi:4-hydroxy-2-oxoheptanedioate aldolase